MKKPGTPNASVAELVARLRETRKESWQYLEVKQLGEILARHREKLRLAVREYRNLGKALAAETDAVEKLYLGYEGMFMRDHLRDALRLYMMVNHDYHDAYRSYMAEINAPAEIIIPFASELLPEKPARKSVTDRRSAA